MNKNTRLLLILLCCAVMASCHESNPSDTATFQSESEMRNILRGEWVRQDYLDSMKAENTPYQLKQLLSELRNISCDSHDLCTIYRGTGNRTIRDEYWDAYKETPCSLKYMPSKGLVFFLHDGHQDTATLWASTHDTVLIFQSEKVKTALVKILVPPCIKGNPYDYLMEMHFFGGKFYLARDEKKLHPIIFTVCGEVHGAEYISPDFKGFSNYGIERGPIYESADRVHLYNKKDKSMWAEAASVDWQRRNDTLQISHELLIKAR